MKSANQIINILQSGKQDLFQKYELKELGVFGSYIRKEQDPESDIDILVDYTKPPGLFSFVRLEEELTGMLGVQVDLVMKSALKPYIGKRILEEVIYI